MKRGLKARILFQMTMPANISSNHCPDEKGTESEKRCRLLSFLFGVATIAPTKRGLKVQSCVLKYNRIECSNHCPDEKGTESAVVRSEV